MEKAAAKENQRHACGEVAREDAAIAVAEFQDRDRESSGRARKRQPQRQEFLPRP